MVSMRTYLPLAAALALAGCDKESGADKTASDKAAATATAKTADGDKQAADNSKKAADGDKSAANGDKRKGPPRGKGDGTNYIKASVPADGVEIALKDRLDGTTSEYCIDIKGGRENVNPANGLQAHTCYSYTGKLGTDQVFAPAHFAKNALYLPAFEVCVTAASLTAGGDMKLAACDGSDAQKFKFVGEGTITSIKNPELCVTAEGATRTGRSKKHQMKPLTLETCSKAKAASQTWFTRKATK